VSLNLANANNKIYYKGLVQVFVTVAHKNVAIILQNVIAFLFFYRTRTLFPKGSYGRILALCIKNDLSPNSQA